LSRQRRILPSFPEQPRRGIDHRKGLFVLAGLEARLNVARRPFQAELEESGPRQEIALPQIAEAFGRRGKSEEKLLLALPRRPVSGHGRQDGGMGQYRLIGLPAGWARAGESRRVAMRLQGLQGFLLARGVESQQRAQASPGGPGSKLAPVA